ncbi:MAG: hypothetical protein H0X12_03170 [Nocardioides sp.]|nr:hypothetical protein [Nocardioides sp.]
MSEADWGIDLVDKDLDLDGWTFLPPDLDGDSRERWLAESAAELEGMVGWDEDRVTADVARALLEQALEMRDESQSVAMLQVWPPFAGQTAMCHVNILPSAAMPSWTSLEDAVIQPTDAPHLGRGLHVITQRMVTMDDGQDVEITGVHFIFDSDEITVMLSLDETLTQLIGLTMPALVALMHNLRVVNTTDGTAFEGVAPPGLLVEEPWDFEASR